jgi:hypothetical protein
MEVALRQQDSVLSRRQQKTVFKSRDLAARWAHAKIPGRWRRCTRGGRRAGVRRGNRLRLVGCGADGRSDRPRRRPAGQRAVRDCRAVGPRRIACEHRSSRTRRGPRKYRGHRRRESGSSPRPGRNRATPRTAGSSTRPSGRDRGLTPDDRRGGHTRRRSSPKCLTPVQPVIVGVKAAFG